MKKINLPLTSETIKSLKAGDELLLNGVIYTARDQAHKRLTEALKSKKRLPFDLNNQTIYYCGPTKTPKGKVIGACGPTTSSRMDKFTPQVLKAGAKGLIGKGARSKEVIRAIKKYKAVYFVAPAGCAAFLAKKVKKAGVVAYSDLGPEAIRKLVVKDFPLILAIDLRGRSLYDAK